MENGKKTTLYDAHQKLSGKIINFAGWALPVQYEGIIPEHEAVRNRAGLFDVSHMGEIEVKGRQALDFVQYLITNDAMTMENGQVIYSLMCYSDGGIVDDLLVYKFSGEHFLLVVNAGNIDKDYKWIVENAKDYEVEISNISDQISELALQGPLAEQILQKITDEDLGEIKFFHFKDGVNIAGTKCLISRTGYTGEDGFEIYTSNEEIEKLWNDILETGKEYGIKACGLGCRDTLRFEAALPLYGNEISQYITPLEAGLGLFVKLGKDSFIGKEALQKQKNEGLKRKLVGFEMLEKAIPRHGYEVVKDGQKIGFVTTGYLSPTLNKSIGLALIDSQYTELGTEISIVMRGKAFKAKVINKKFYDKKYKK